MYRSAILHDGVYFLLPKWEFKKPVQKTGRFVLYLWDSTMIYMRTLSWCIARLSKLKLRVRIFWNLGELIFQDWDLLNSFIETEEDSVLKIKWFCIDLLWFLLTSLQVTDYAIARRIVDLHSRLGEAVERIYSVVGLCSFVKSDMP